MSQQRPESRESTEIPDSEAIEWHSTKLSGLRKALISKEELAIFTQRNSARWISAVAFDLLIIVLAAVLAEFYFNPFTYLLAVIIIAGRQVGIASIALHDGAHRFLAKDATLNHRLGTLILSLLTVPCIGIDTQGYRKGLHLDHHRYLLQDEDPENELFAKYYANGRAKTLRSFLSMTALTLTGVGYVYGLLHQIVLAKPAQKLVNVALIATMVLGVVQDIYLLRLVLLYWIIPVATWSLFTNRVRAMAEHYPAHAFGGDFQYPQDLRTRDVKPSLFDKLFVTTRNVNLHLSHHLFPAVPFYNLDKLHSKISKTEAYQKVAHQTHGYHQFIYEYLFLRPIPENLHDAK